MATFCSYWGDKKRDFLFHESRLRLKPPSFKVRFTAFDSFLNVTCNENVFSSDTKNIPEFDMKAPHFANQEFMFSTLAAAAWRHLATSSRLVRNQKQSSLYEIKVAYKLLFVLFFSHNKHMYIKWNEILCILVSTGQELHQLGRKLQTQAHAVGEARAYVSYVQAVKQVIVDIKSDTTKRTVATHYALGGSVVPSIRH